MAIAPSPSMTIDVLDPRMTLGHLNRKSRGTARKRPWSPAMGGDRPGSRGEPFSARKHLDERGEVSSTSRLAPSEAAGDGSGVAANSGAKRPKPESRRKAASVRTSRAEESTGRAVPGGPLQSSQIEECKYITKDHAPAQAENGAQEPERPQEGRRAQVGHRQGPGDPARLRRPLLQVGHDQEDHRHAGERADQSRPASGSRSRRRSPPGGRRSSGRPSARDPTNAPTGRSRLGSRSRLRCTGPIRRDDDCEERETQALAGSAGMKGTQAGREGEVSRDGRRDGHRQAPALADRLGIRERQGDSRHQPRAGSIRPSRPRRYSPGRIRESGRTMAVELGSPRIRPLARGPIRRPTARSPWMTAINTMHFTRIP